MKIKPLGNRVLIRSVTADEKTSGGLYVPGTLTERYLKGEVLAVGSGEVCGTYDTSIVLKKVTVQPGDIVLYDSARTIDVGDGLFLLDENDLQCKFVPANPTETN